MISKSRFHDGPAYVVKEKILNGQIKPDPNQLIVINKLQELYENLKHYSPGKIKNLRPPKGVYIHGSVGAGKTMLMDIFYESVKVKSLTFLKLN